MIDATPLLRLYAKFRARRLARQNAAAIQERTLRHLLRRAAATRFGRDHGFSGIDNPAAVGSDHRFHRGGIDPLAVEIHLHEVILLSADADLAEILAGALGNGQGLVERGGIHVLFHDRKTIEIDFLEDIAQGQEIDPAGRIVRMDFREVGAAVPDLLEDHRPVSFRPLSCPAQRLEQARCVQLPRLAPILIV